MSPASPRSVPCHDVSFISLLGTFLTSRSDHAEGTPIAKREMHQPVPLPLSQRGHDKASTLDCRCSCQHDEYVSICLTNQCSVTVVFVLF